MYPSSVSVFFKNPADCEVIKRSKDDEEMPVSAKELNN